jgi:hypothetical protein
VMRDRTDKPKRTDGRTDGRTDVAERSSRLVLFTSTVQGESSDYCYYKLLICYMCMYVCMYVSLSTIERESGWWWPFARSRGAPARSRSSVGCIVLYCIVVRMRVGGLQLRVAGRAASVRPLAR